MIGFIRYVAGDLSFLLLRRLNIREFSQVCVWGVACHRFGECKSDAEMRLKMNKIGKWLLCLSMAIILFVGESLGSIMESEAKATDGEMIQSVSAKKGTIASAKVKKGAKSRKEIKIALDAGHQSCADSGTEPVGPGSSVKKMKVAGGATGVATGTPEYKLTLRVAKRLKKVLVAKGYKVYMIRTKNNVNISNRQRAVRANKSGADIYIRIHADASSSSSVRGASMLYPSTSNAYVKNLSKPSKKLSNCILKSYCKRTGIKSRGLIQRDDLTGTNWSKIPVTLIEMGFLSNASEDRFMQKASNQEKMAAGIADGIDDYFGF